MLYNPPTGGGSNDPYVGKNLAAGQQGSKVPPAALENPQREIVAAITDAGLVPTNTDLTQLSQAIKVKAKKEIGRGITLALSSPQAVPNLTETAVSWPQPLLDTEGIWNASLPSRVRIPIGVKRFRVTYENCFEANSTGSRKSRILLDGVGEGFGMPAARTLAAGAADVTILQCAGGIVDITTLPAPLSPDGSHYLQLMVVQDSGGSLNQRATNTWISVEWLG